MNRPVDEVFAYVADPANLGEWQTNLVSVTRRPVLGRLLHREFGSDYARLKDALESGRS